MNTKRCVTVLMLLVLALVFLVFVSGCKKSSQPADANKPISVSAGGIEQTMCPVLEAPIDKNVYVEYEGKRVYFCCTMCKDQFLKEPQKYLAKLPQFKK